MSKKRISPHARIQGPSPEQVGRRNLIIGLLIAAAVVLAVGIAVAMNRSGNQAASANNAQQSPAKTANTGAGSQATAGDGGTGQPAAPSSPATSQSVAASQQANPPQAAKGAHRVTINTAKGQIVLEVYPDLMPITVANFDKLVKVGFYNGLKFHRVLDWVAQGGDPKGDGSGGSDQTIKLETNPQLKNVRGAVAMARSSDPNSASSQFYILKKDVSSLDGDYAVFGKVISGMDVVDQIQIGDKMLTVKE